MTQASHAASERDRVIVFDTTMRDGEQSPGASMSLEEKLELAKILEEMRVDVIEAGFPIASNGDFEAVRQISEIVTESTICGLARAAAVDIERCAEAIRPAKRGRRKAAPRVNRNALSGRGDGVPPRRSRSSSPDAPPAKRASSAGSSVCDYDSEAPEEIQNEALYRACRAYGLGEQFLAAAQDEGTFGEWLDELPFEVAAAAARLLKHHARSGAWVELSPGNPSQASRAGRDRDRSSPNCPSDMSELSENSD